MKATKTQSMRSIRSTKSMRSMGGYLDDDKPMAFDEVLTNACLKLMCSRHIIVNMQCKPMMQMETVKYKKISIAQAFVKPLPTPSDKETKSDESDSKSCATTIEENVTVVTAMSDNMNRLTEILIEKQKCVPRKLIQILGIVTPHYIYLTKMSIRRSRIDSYTIFEMGKFLPLTSITEICLDDSPVAGYANYTCLLEKPCRLTSLSLSRCSICDDVCVEIASKLHFSESAEATLSTLNLSSNRITDIGARSIGEALRSNRHLRYLNLADNWIGDDGAHHILGALTDFSLTYDEILDKRRSYMAYLRTKRAIYLKYYSEWDSRSLDEYSLASKKPKKSVKPKKDKLKSNMDVDDIAHMRAEMLARELVGQFVHPFTSYSTKLIDGYSHCIGNMFLCFLNLSYNDLSYISLKKLHSVVLYQSIHKKMGQTGLMKVRIEGNPIPTSCAESTIISDLLQKNIISFSPRFVADRKKSRGRISIVPEKLIAVYK